jgi:hypothetical protein
MTMGASAPVLSRSCRKFSMISSMNSEEFSNLLCQDSNANYIMTSGPATEALEKQQSLKRRRLSNDSDSTKQETETSTNDDSSSAFCLDDAFNAISSVENEDYCDFPTIAWDFDDC